MSWVFVVITKMFRMAPHVISDGRHSAASLKKRKREFMTPSHMHTHPSHFWWCASLVRFWVKSVWVEASERTSWIVLVEVCWRNGKMSYLGYKVAHAPFKNSHK